MSGYALAADVGGTKIAVARVSDAGVVSHRLEAPTPAEGDEAAVEVLAELLQRLPREDVCAVGIDVPGLARRDGTVWAPNIRGWDRMPLREKMEERFAWPVVVESDRNAFVMGEAWRGAAQGCQDAILLIIGTGIGAGILSGGRLLRGHGELAGAAGWLALREEHQPEYAAVGCAEAQLAGPGLAREASRRLGRSVDTRELVRMARDGDATAIAIWNEAGHRLGLLLANLVSLLNPEVIVLDGGVSAAGSLLLKPARATLRRWAQPLAARQVRLVRSRLGANAGLLGMARLALSGAEGQGSPIRKDKREDEDD